MRELIGSFLILIVALALTLFGIGFGYPGHPYAVGSVMIFAACYSYYLFERVYVKPDMLERAQRDAARMILRLRASEFYRVAQFPFAIGIVAAYWTLFPAMILRWSPEKFFILFGVVFVLAFVGSMLVRKRFWHVRIG